MHRGVRPGAARSPRPQPVSLASIFIIAFAICTALGVFVSHFFGVRITFWSDLWSGILQGLRQPVRG